MGRKKKKRSRKAQEDKEFIQHLSMLARTGATVSESAAALGLTDQQLDDLFRKRPKILKAWKKSRLNLILGVRAALTKSAMAGEFASIKKLLEEMIKGELAQQPSPAIDFTRLRTSELSVIINKPRVTIDRWKNEHGLRRAVDKTYNLADVFSWFEMYCKGKYATASGLSGDSLRDIKAEMIRLELDKKRKVLLDRQEVVCLEIFWIQNLKTRCSRGAEELAGLCQAQSRKKIKELMDTWFKDLFLSMTKVPIHLSLPPAMDRELEDFMKRLKPHDYSGEEIHPLPKVEGLKR